MDVSRSKVPGVRAILTLAFLGLTAACGELQVRPTRVCVMAYNIKHGAGMDGTIDLERAAAVIRAHDPDLVALQEVDVRTKRSGMIDQPAELARLTGMHPAFAKFMDYDGGEYGLAILSKSPIDARRRIELPSGKHEPRAALAVRTTPTGCGTPLEFVSVHFDWLRDDAERFSQANRLIDSLDSVDVPMVLAGDFNDLPESRTMRRIFEVFADIPKPADDRFTFSSTDPRREIDFIVARPSMAVTGRCDVIDEPMASDHRPVVATLTVAPASR